MDQQYPNNVPGYDKAVASLVCGIVSTVLSFTGHLSFIAFLVAIAGLVLSSSAKKEGFYGSQQTWGFVLSLIGLILSGAVFLACAACTACGVAGACALM
ncbi:MAG TPA: hypothetical protein PLN48_15270 [Lachnospiraceae bacterium]|nr:hypothetical protein [Lachnospiraceae bacterium]